MSTERASAARQQLDVLLAIAELRAERRVAVLRIVVAVAIALTIGIAVEGTDFANVNVRAQVLLALLTSALLALSGAAAYTMLSTARWRSWMAYAVVAADVGMIIGNLIAGLLVTGLPGDFVSAFPALWVAPIIVAITALRFRPRVTAFAGVVLVIGLVVAAAVGGHLDIPERQVVLPQIAPIFGLPPNAIRLVMVAIFCVVLTLVAWRGRDLLVSAIEESSRRQTLGRYLPNELSTMVTEQRIEDLRAGRRLTAGLLFVDIRGSTALSEALPPEELSVLISSFRRRVGAAVAETGGMIDKFVGDGAFVVFGVTRSTGDEAQRALACARAIVERIDAWNEKRGNAKPPIRVGIGVHVGEVFCGVLGDENRLEFTVLGDAVNHACRIEQATKRYGCRVLASSETVAAAGALAEWEEVARDRLPGSGLELTLMRPGRLWKAAA